MQTLNSLTPLLLATTNPGKFHELETALIGLPFEFRSLRDLPASLRAEEPEESGATFAENARIKAEFWHARTGLATLADDSGILVDALPDELGVHTVRFGVGKNASDEEWLTHFLERMRDAPTEKRGAEFVCTLALAGLSFPKENSAIQNLAIPRRRDTSKIQNSSTLFFEGKIRGTIADQQEAQIQKGIPLSSVFRPLGSEQVFSAMTTEEKKTWSHRGRALAELRTYLEKFGKLNPSLGAP